MDMSAFPNIKMRGNGENGKKGCRQKKGMLGKLADIDMLAQHVADMSPTFPTKSMATAVRRCDTKRITQCSMSRATPEATGGRHRATTCSILPQQLPGQQAIKQQSTNTPTKLAILMAMAMHWYVPVHIAQWRRSRASLEATERRHRASIMSNNINWIWLRCFFLMFSLS